MFCDQLVTKKAQWRNKSSPTTIQHGELFLGKDISGSHASKEGEEHGKKPGGPGALLLWHSGNWTPRLWPTITGAYPILLMKLTCAHLNVYMHIAQLIINCVHLSCTKPLFMIVSSFFTNYRCNILPASPWHHSSVQHPQSSLLSPHQHFLSGSPHPQDAEIFQHISSARYFTFGGLVCGYYDYVGSSPSNPVHL